MPYRLATADREHDKFVECPTGETAVRTCIANDSTNPVPVDLGSTSVSVGVAAPTGPLRRSVVNVTDVAADPIAIPLANRVALTIRNKDAVHTVYLGEDNTITQDDTVTGGWEIGPGEDFSIDLSEDNNFFLIAPAGQTVVVKILEIASSAAGGGGGGGLPGVMTQEIPSGLINNANTTFTITTNPLGAGYFTLYLDGILLRAGTHYTRVGQTITMVTAPNFGQTLDAVYWY